MADARNAGRLLARLLAGSWRQSRVPAPVADAARLADLLSIGGIGGLVWRLVRDDASGVKSRSLRSLRDAYRGTLIDHAEHEARLCDVFAEVRCGGIEAIVVKGWSVARLYPELGSRPCGDIDLCVPPDRFDATSAILQESRVASFVDLHAGIADLDGRDWSSVRERSRLVPLDGFDIRILGAEDQLRHLCLHMMRHGAFRPLWLCDIAAAVENRPADFDWDALLHGDARRSEWVRCALGLARDLLGAEVPLDVAVPAWLEEAVLREWVAGRMGDSNMRDPIPMATHLQDPRRWIGALRARWPNPIEAAFKTGASPWTRIPLAWHQLRYGSRRVIRLRAKTQTRATLSPTPFDVHLDS